MIVSFVAPIKVTLHVILPYPLVGGNADIKAGFDDYRAFADAALQEVDSLGLQEAQVVQAFVAFRLARLAEAKQWSDVHDCEEPLMPMYTFQNCASLQAKVCLAHWIALYRLRCIECACVSVRDVLAPEERALSSIDGASDAGATKLCGFV